MTETRTGTAILAALTRIAVLVLLFVGGAGTAQAQEEGGGAAEAFAVEALNEGLGDVGDLDRSTPRASMEGFVDSAERWDYSTAAHFLNLNDLPPDMQAERGAELAHHLHEVIHRTIWIDWTSLPDRPDAVDEFASADAPSAGEPRRSLRLGIVDSAGRPVEIRLNRYQPEGGEAVWLFSERTVDYVPALYAEHGPGRLEGLLPTALQREAFWGIPLWQIIAVPLIFVVAAFAGFFTYRLVQALGRRIGAPLENSSGVRWLPQIVSQAAMPVAMLVAASLVAILHAELLTFSGPTNVIVSSLITIALVVAVAFVLLRIIGTILDIVTSNFVWSIDDEENSASRALYTNISVARRIVILLALVFGAAVVMFQLNLSQTLGVSLLASAGVLSLIFGFAAQAVLGNILASVQIAIAKPIRIGDAVLYEEDWGYIEEINFTYVLIRTWDKRRLIVPVRHFVSEPFENWSMRDASLIMPIELKLDPTADLEVLRKAFEEMLDEDEDWDRQQEPKVLAIAHDDRALTIRFYSSAKNPSAAWDLHCRLREKLFAFIRDHESGRWLPRDRQQMLDVEGRPTAIGDADAAQVV